MEFNSGFKGLKSCIDPVT